MIVRKVVAFKFAQGVANRSFKGKPTFKATFKINTGVTGNILLAAAGVARGVSAPFEIVIASFLHDANKTTEAAKRNVFFIFV